MMTHACADSYLDDAMRNLGESFDYAINDCLIDPDELMHLFVATGYASDFENRNPKIISGLSGTELAIEILYKSKTLENFPSPKESYDYSQAYWVGWILAYYQSKTGKTFKDIHKYISMKEIEGMYYPLHEASEEKFVETLNKIIRKRKKSTNLQTQRKYAGLSQSELANKAKVNLRTLQQYEIGTKDINKASAKAVLSIASALGCKIEDILEY